MKTVGHYQFLTQDVTAGEASDSKALSPGLWDHNCLLKYKRPWTSPLLHKHSLSGLARTLADSGLTMKVLVVLVLAVFAGCNANLLYADAPKPQLEVLADQFWDYVGKATQTADDTLQMIRSSQFGQDVSARLTESADLASKYATSIQEQLPLPPRTSSPRGQLEPYTEEMKIQIQQKVEQLKQELAPYADNLDAEALRTALVQKSEELKASLEQSVKDLQTQLGPYTDDLKVKVDQHLQDFKDNLTP
ncbi:hypothetical protein WMY93_026912 [Mugilogobius chulae]|uniref:Apolipoprotein A-IV n=1 Tax=Mugilogobius chulae TaxID=88201 RepID=A0AAW0N953_9GOBI